MTEEGSKAMAYGEVKPECPVSILQRHSDVTVYLTEESAKAAGIYWQELSAKAHGGESKIEAQR